MNSGASKPALIGIDWGTSSLRAYLISAQGKVLDQHSSPEGIMQVKNKDFETVFARTVDTWLTTNANLPLITSGMITSRNGWLETPYLAAPVSIKQLAEALVPLKTAKGLTLHCVTGVTTEQGNAPDVMRGEETQIAGALQAGLIDGLFVMPGTHSKWVSIGDGRIENFETVMTGEVFDVLRRHTILGTLMDEGGFSEEGFQRGVTAGLNAGPKLLHSLFSTRTLPLFEKIDKSKVSDYLSGMLIGAEIQGAVTNKTINEPITIVGRDDLADRYAKALQIFGLQSQRAAEDIVTRGYFAIATAARLIA